MIPTVLLADDSQFVREALGRALHLWGECRVVAVQNGKEALEALKADPTIRAMVLDVNMPILDGREVLRRVDAAVARSIFIIAVGDGHDPGMLEECRHLGAHETLTKPLDVESLVGLLRGALRNSNQDQ